MCANTCDIKIRCHAQVFGPRQHSGVWLLATIYALCIVAALLPSHHVRYAHAQGQAARRRVKPEVTWTGQRKRRRPLQPGERPHWRSRPTNDTVDRAVCVVSMFCGVDASCPAQFSKQLFTRILRLKSHYVHKNRMLTQTEPCLVHCVCVCQPSREARPQSARSESNQ